MRMLQDECIAQLHGAWRFVNSETGRGILKCSLAYLIGSMATFVPILSDFLGQQDGKHMVATVTVYFHPARSQGSMFEAVFLALMAFVYATFISFTSMGVSMFFGQSLHMIVLGHIVVLIVFCGGGLGLVGWAKQRLGNPLVNVACSLTSLAIITVLTKEGAVQAAEFSDDKVVQVMKMIIMGVIATTVVCFTIKPISARKKLRQNMIDVTNSFGDMLAMITRGFLTGSEEELEQRSFVTASDHYRKVFDSLKKNLKEAKYEHYVLGTEVEYHLEAKIVSCMQRMAQNIGGLRSAAATQFSLLSQAGFGGGATPMTATYTPVSPTQANFSRVDSWMSNQENYGVLTAIDESPEEDEFPASTQGDTHSGLPTVRSPTEIFERFIMHLGPSMVSTSLVYFLIRANQPY